jgi:hypothetical protein
MGVRFDPDPCKPRCIWLRFSTEAQEWWSIFQTVTKRWENKEKHKTCYELDWQAVDVVFDSYDVKDRRFGINILFVIMNLLDNPTDLTTEQVFGWEPLDSGDR